MKKFNEWIDPTPTEAQKEAGNYQKEHITLYGLDIALENKKGSERSGVDKDGKKWAVTMPADYGYIKRTKGNDGDHVDVYVGAQITKETPIFVVDQLKAEDGSFDEHKVMMGFYDKAAAMKTYLAGFSDGKGKQRLGTITEMSPKEFLKWLDDGDMKKPLAYSDRLPE